MGTVNFQKLYRETFARLGCELKAQDAVSETMLSKAERRLGAKLPGALRHYYLVAGREKSLNHAFNRLLPVNALELHHGKLPFMEENQWAVVWGVDLGALAVADPPVFQGPVVHGEAKNWFPECDQCSGFLVFMLHLQAAYGGGMPFAASASATLEVRPKLDAGWTFAGEINKMRAYSRNGQAVCFVKWPDLVKKTETWQVFAGASSEIALGTIQKDLAVTWEYQRNHPGSVR